MKAYELVGQTLGRLGADMGFFLMGGPTHGVGNSCIANGVRMIDVRHEQAAVMMAHAYARLRSRPGLCMAASGPGVMNLGAGLANALVDCAPVVALGGAAPMAGHPSGDFQDIDQVAVMRPVTKWADRVNEPRQLPRMLVEAFVQAGSGKPGPVYLDLPADVLYSEVDPAAVHWPEVALDADHTRSAANEEQIARLFELLHKASRPVVISGSGVLWSGAAQELRQFVERCGIPLYTTPQGRGVIPEDHSLSFPAARSQALKEADLVLVLGTRLNYVWGHGEPPRISANAQFVRIDVDAAEVASSGRMALGIVADARTVLQQCLDRLGSSGVPAAKFKAWTDSLHAVNVKKSQAAEARLSNDSTPIHPLRLCKELRDFMDRDAILVVDGQEILNFGRQSIPIFAPGHSLNSGTFGTMGVGLPYGVGAKAARPRSQVIVLHGDGSFGLNAMELDTAVRHKLPILVVISNNGGWTSDPEGSKPGRHLGFTRYDEMAKGLGCHGEHVEAPGEIAPALRRAGDAVRSGRCAVVNVVTDPDARATTAEFTSYVT